MSEVVASWTEERVAALHRLLARGLTAEEIAAELGSVSRNGVIGKVHRLGLNFLRAGIERSAWQEKSASARPARSAKPSVPQQPTARPISRPVVVAAPEPAIEPTQKAWPKPAGSEAVDLAGLDMFRQCRMPLWANLARSGLYCGKPISAEGESWCAACAKLVYERRPIRAREETQAAQGRIIRQAARTGAFA